MQMCLNINFYSKWINVHLQWFEEKQQQIETLDQQLKKLHQSIEMLFVQRKGWCTIIEKEKKIFNFFIQLVVSIEKYLTRKQCLANIKFILLVSPQRFLQAENFRRCSSLMQVSAQIWLFSKKYSTDLNRFSKICDLKIPLFGIHTLYIANYQFCKANSTATFFLFGIYQIVLESNGKLCNLTFILFCFCT